MYKGQNETWSQAKVKMRKAEAKLIRIFPQVLGMKKDVFIKEMAKELHYHDETIATYLKKGFSDERSPQEICTALKNIYERFISDKSISEEVRDAAKNGYEIFGEHMFETINKMEDWFMEIEPFKSLFTDKHSKYRVVSAFMAGFWPESGEGLTPEETALLKEALLEFPPKGIELPK